MSNLELKLQASTKAFWWIEKAIELTQEKRLRLANQCLKQAKLWENISKFN